MIRLHLATVTSLFLTFASAAETVPFIVRQPASQIVAGGSTATLDVIASAAPTNRIEVFGGPLSTTNLFEVGANAGRVSLRYDCQTLPDEMRVYFDGALLTNFGYLSDTGLLSVSFGPGQDTHLTIVVNEDNQLIGTVWTYTAFIPPGPLAYQWWKDGSPVPGATNSSLSLSNAQPSQTGNYTVIVSNSFGSVTSKIAHLSVQPALTMRRVNASQFDVAWPVVFDGYELQSTSRLEPPLWSRVTAPDAPDATQHHVLINNTEARHLFRLWLVEP